MINNFLSPERPSKLSDYLFAVIAIITITFFCYLFHFIIGYQSVAFILLLTVLILPLFFQYKPVLLAAALSALLWNFLFIPPYFTFYIAKLEDVLMFGMYFIIAIVTGILTSRIKLQERIARYREERTNAVYVITRELATAVSLDKVIEVSINNIKSFFNSETLIILADNKKLDKNIHPLSTFSINEKEIGIANWTFQNKQKSGKYTNTLSSAQAIYYPLITPRTVIGVIGINLQTKNFQPEQESLLETFIFQIASSLERELLNEQAAKVKLSEESEKLHSTLLNSISHELRTPLVTIMGATSSLFDKNNSENNEIRDELNMEIYLASERLNRLVENLLDMSRLESGQLKLKLKYHDINELITAVLTGLKSELKDHQVILDIEEDLPLIKIDFGIMEQVLTNIIINSTIYTPSDSVIEIKIKKQENYLLIEISDNGQGLPEEYIEKIFDKFYRIPGTKTGGTGLGLSIVKGFVEAHNGIINVRNKKTGGAEFIIKLFYE